MPRARAALALLAAALPLVGACRALFGRDTIDLDGVEVKSMGVDIRRRQKTICPRQRVQMAVFADIVKAAGKPPIQVETWEGNGSRNGKLDFADFAFRSPDGSFDGEGWFRPRSDLRATLSREIVITTAYRRQPTKFTFETRFKPDYDCISGTGADGATGTSGTDGAQGSAGTSGTAGVTTYGSSTGGSGSQSHQGPGGNGGDGGRGQPGGPGGPGSAGPRITIHLAMVKTPFYERLIAARISGDVTDFLLYPPERKLSVHANGGPGGRGGNGGEGGPGGPGGSGSPPGAQGAKGAQGQGGAGGPGGRGGRVEVFFDQRFEAELLAGVAAQANGGAGGPGGSGGGASGASGEPGQVERRPADVRGSFADISGITVLE